MVFTCPGCGQRVTVMIDKDAMQHVLADEQGHLYCTAKCWIRTRERRMAQK